MQFSAASGNEYMKVGEGRATIIFQDTAVDTSLLISPLAAPNENAEALRSNAPGDTYIKIQAGAIAKTLSILSLGLLTAAMF